MKAEDKTKEQLMDELAGLRQRIAELERSKKECKEIQESLERLSKRNELILDSVGEGIYGVDLEGNTTFINPSAARMLGYKADELVGKHMHEIMHHTRPDGTPYPQEECKMYAAFKDGVAHYVTDEVFWRRDGTSFPVEYLSTPIRDRKGITGAVVIFRDITERKRTEEELKRSNTELEQFAYIASHDLQEPLRMVSGFTQLLARRYKGRLDKDADEFIAYIVDGAARMQRMIEDLLAYSRVGTRGKPFEPTDLDAVLDQALTNLKASIEQNGAVITHDTLPAVMADPTQMVQLFQNLIGNAIKFRKKGEPPRIHISAQRKGNEWVFPVKDNGIGIAHEFMGHLFQLFQREHAAGEYPGTGIGLAICKRIVGRHGGRIWAESEPGKGSTFYFTMPVKGERPDDRDAQNQLVM